MSKQNVGWNFHNTYAGLPTCFFTQTEPEKVPHPEVVIINFCLGKAIGLNLEILNAHELALLFSGNFLPNGALPISQAYAGHQFGYFTYLGDGRAHLIGEQLSPDGKRIDVQLKGSGKTPYGRRGDGKAVLGPMLREYLISEAMHALEIPTTRSLAVVLTGEKIYRESLLPGAILTRVASSHIRVGTFEFAAKNSPINLKTLADYTISRHYPHVMEASNSYLSLLEVVIERQIDLIVNWMRVGFIHGVMNTDNMSINGETIDYGPCAFMDTYDPATVFSSIDREGRYAYGNQPFIAQWNLAIFAGTLLPLLAPDPKKAIKVAEQAIEKISSMYETKWLNMMRGKLGLFNEQSSDKQLISDLLNWMQNQKADFTNTFRALTSNNTHTLLENPQFQAWYRRWQQRLIQNNKSPEFSWELMKKNNPAIIPRNHKVDRALKAAINKDYKPFKELLNVLAFPYEDRNNIKLYQLPPKPGEEIFQTFCGT